MHTRARLFKTNDLGSSHFVKLQTLISDRCQNFLLKKKCEEFLHCKSFSYFFNKILEYLFIRSLNILQVDLSTSLLS